MTLVLKNAWRVQSACRASKAVIRSFGVSSASRLAPLRCTQTLQTRREDEGTTSQVPPLIYPESPSAGKHHNLASFLHYADHTSLDPASTTYVGTYYEYTVAEQFARLGFDLRRIGGASDRGIDLLGTWAIPKDTAQEDKGSPAPIRVLLQCKAGTGQRVGPHLVRELEGAFVGAPPGWRSRSDATDSSELAVLGLLVTEKPATKGIRDALARSRWPMAFLCCSNTGQIKQMLWNQRAEQDAGLAGLGVTVRHSQDGSKDSGAHLVLTWHGRVLPAASPAPISDSDSAGARAS